MKRWLYSIWTSPLGWLSNTLGPLVLFSCWYGFVRGGQNLMIQTGRGSKRPERELPEDEASLCSQMELRCGSLVERMRSRPSAAGTARRSSAHLAVQWEV